jgi:DNA-binding PucR family transcriptional regulator
VISTALTGWRAAVGPAVPVSELGRSLEWARLCLDLVRSGVLPDQPVSQCTEHLSSLWLFSDASLADALIEHTLQPLLELTDKQRHKLGTTLMALLQTSGSAPEIATMLGVHPQTVRYRMHQLEALFGDRLEDRDGRFDLMVALRAMSLRENATTG